MTFRLPRDVGAEIDQVAHRGKVGLVRNAVVSAAEAYERAEFAEAIDLLADAKRHAPRSGVVRELLGLSYYHLERWREAAREFAAYRRLSGRRDQDGPYADAERALGRPERALAILEGLEEEPLDEERRIEALIVRAGALRDLGRTDQAVDVLRGGSVSPPEVQEHHLRLWYSLADALEESGDRSEARSWWDAIYAEDPEFFDVGRRRMGLRGR